MLQTPANIYFLEFAIGNSKIFDNWVKGILLSAALNNYLFIFVVFSLKNCNKTSVN